MWPDFQKRFRGRELDDIAERLKESRGLVARISVRECFGTSLAYPYCIEGTFCKRALADGEEGEEVGVGS